MDLVWKHKISASISVTHLPPGSPCCSHGIRGNSVACSKSFYNNCVESLHLWLDES